jgi:hopanoid-associated phosphorylase
VHPTARSCEHQSVLAVTCLAFEAQIAAGAGVTVLCAPRRESLVESVKRAAAHASGIISFGVAAGLDPGLRPGDWVIASSVITQEARYCADSRWVQSLRTALPAAICGDVSGVDAPVASAAAKTVLYREQRTVAVDTESHVVAQVAATSRIPFVAARVVLDPAWRPLPPAALAPLSPDGNPDISAVARSVLLMPGQLADLGKVAWDAFRAWQALRHGRRSLGAHLLFPYEAPEQEAALEPAALEPAPNAACAASAPCAVSI